jgi:hypothetical protein
MERNIFESDNLEINGFILKLTCPAYPEQYDVYKDGVQVGYLRLRHGYFTCDYPDCNGETIYEAEPKGDGYFEDDERLQYLTQALDVLQLKIDSLIV